MTATSKEEFSVDEPAGIEDLEQRITEQQATLDRLETLSDEIDALYDDAAEMDESSRETIAEEMRQIQHEVVQSASIDELENLKERIAEVIAAPYRQAVKRARETVCETVGINDELDEDTFDELNETLQHCEANELQNMAEAFERVQDKLTTLPEAAQTAVGRTIMADARRFLTNPESKLEPVVETVDHQADALKTVDEALDRTAWGPDAPLAENSDYYGDNMDTVDADMIVEYVDTVNDRLVDTEGLDLTTVAQAHISQEIPVEKPAKFVHLFEGLSRDITKASGHEVMYTHASTLVDTVDDLSEHEASDVGGYVTEIDKFIEEPGGDTPANRLAEKLRRLNEAYNQWTETYASLLKRDAVAIEAVDSLTDLQDFKSPLEAIDLMDEDITAETVSERPEEAVAAHQAYEDWGETLRGKVSSNSGADIDNLLMLVRGETVSAAELDSEGFETLAELLGDELTLNLTDGPKEEA